MQTVEEARSDLLALLRERSVFYGDFLLASGARSPYYVDCKLTTYNPQGAWLVGRAMHALIRRTEAECGAPVDAVGGLTMGADPIALATGMVSLQAGDPKPLQVFVVRKSPKAHGQTKLIEGNFRPGDRVVVIDDVITRGESTIKALEAVKAEGGTVAFVAALVDREEGGSRKIEAMGHRVVAIFTKGDVLRAGAPEAHA